MHESVNVCMMSVYTCVCLNVCMRACECVCVHVLVLSWSQVQWHMSEASATLEG